MKYHIQYLAALYDALEIGGKQEAVEKIIAEVNNPTQAGLDAWIATVETIPCAACGEPFKPDQPKLDQEVLCPKHASPS